ncbi:MAG: DUF2877 domain-containing protein [Deltaproteobacteria bacterium]|nr:DUF2877 domain-containing protein [Deltaproteobacteria bacterium]MBW1873555.1 DUF2877 domain-containing protein [Deltaproteobacteria bacterium]
MTHLPVHRFDRQIVEHLHDFKGRVARVYKQAAIIRPADQGPLITLLHSGQDLVPYGIGIPWGLVRPAVDQQVSINGRKLTLWVSPFIKRGLLLEGAGINLCIDQICKNLDQAACRQELAGIHLPVRTRDLLDPEKVVGHGIQPDIVRAAGRRLRKLIKRLCCKTEMCGPFSPIISGLAGLGPGSTPSGDDLLLGVAAAAYYMTSAGLIPRRNLIKYLTALDELPADASTEAGREMIAHAVQGAFPEPLLRFVVCLGQYKENKSKVSWEATRLTRIGKHSGCDMLAGAFALASLATSVQGAPA